MKTEQVVAEAIRLIKLEGRDEAMVAGFGMCAYLLSSQSTIRNTLLQSGYSCSQLKNAAVHTKHFVDCLAGAREYGYLLDALSERYGEETAVNKWFKIYEDWENRYDYV